MKKILFPICCFVAGALCAQTPPKVNWKIDKPFEQKVFIENKGQYNGHDGLDNSTILYAMDNLGGYIFFTTKGLTYKIEETTITGDDLKGEFLRKAAGLFGKKEKEMDEVDIKVKKSFLNMEWVGASTSVKVVATDMTRDYYNYNLDGTSKGAVSHARAYKKLTYKNLYPGIDVEYVFHEKEGIKYTLIVHPGADPSLIKMKYKSKGTIALDKAGDLHFPTAFGDIVDHAPITFLEGGEAVTSSFRLEGSVVSFNLGLTADQKLKIKDKKLIIDPWTVNPSFTNANKVFDVEPDAFGNVYAYGGSAPWKLKKFDNTGTLVWTFNNPNSPMYGDMDVVMGTGVTYLTTGLQGTITKVWSNGTMAWNQTTICNYEYWTVNANCAGNRVVVTASFSSSNTSGLANIDTTTGTCGGLVNFTISGSNPDFRCAVWAPNNNFYLTQTRGNQVNELWARTSLFAPIYTLLAGYTSPYNGTPLYAVSFIQPYNGIDADLQNIYMTSGMQLLKKNINNGQNIATINIPGGGLMSCNGVAVDGCNTVYVGSTNGVYKFDSSLVQLSSQTTNAVYDVTLGPTGDVLCGGDQFLASLNFNACPAPQGATLGITSSSVDATCSNNNGSITVTATGGTGAYTYTWTPSGQTGQTATGLSAGIYTVNIKDATGCNAGTKTVSISGGGLNLSTQSLNIPCNGQLTGSASVTSSGGVGTYTYSWSSGQTTQGITGLAAGGYTVTVTDSLGCTRTQAFSITEPSALVTLDSTNNINCFGGTGSSFALVSGGTGAYTYTWSNGSTSSGITGLSAGNYTVVVADANGCTTTRQVTITQPNQLVLTATGNSVNCTDDTLASATASTNGGTSPYTYSWSNGATTSSITGLTAGSYTVMVTDANGCTSLQVVNVVVNTKPKASISATPTSGQVPLSVVFTNGSTGGVSYSWIFGDGNSASTQNATNTYLSGGTYTVMMIVTASNGCKDTAYITIIADGFSTIIVPNVFSPNGDGTNDVFVIESIGLKDLTLEIYDRWGLLMSTITSITGGWDGKAKSGNDAPEGTYYYILKANGIDNKVYDMKGYLMLLRD